MPYSEANWLDRRRVAGAALLIILYTGFYLGDSALPGNNLNACCVTGWIGWWDQGRYYASARALSKGILDPAEHWYPLGYAILSVPFSFLRSHRFFAVDLICLLATYEAFVAFARRTGLSISMAVTLFFLSTFLDAMIFKQWAIPWSTTPAAALIWVLLAAAATHLQGRRHPLLLGLVAGALPAMRPTDGIISAICLLWVVVADLRAGRLRWRDVALLATGIAAVALPYAALHLAIYGPRASSYMVKSRAIGFTLHNPVWRAYVLLIEPRQWFFAGQGLLARMPWLLFGFAGIVTAWRRGGLVSLLACCLAAYCLLMLFYVDLLPTGLWRYYNVHYFKWTFPGFGLLAWLLVRDLWARDRLAWATLAMFVLLSCLRVTPRLAGPEEPAIAVDLPGPVATEANTTMTQSLTALDARGILQNVTTMRAFPFPSGDGVRLIGLRRDIEGEVSWVPGLGLRMPAESPPERRWAERIEFGYPCWLPPHPCKKEPHAR